MRDKNGIEIKCANCHYQSRNFGQCLAALIRPKCENGSLFEPKRTVIEARIRELQACVTAKNECIEAYKAKIAELEEANKDLSEGVNISYQLGRRDAMRAERGTKEWNMRDKIKLNQCPFCGGKAKLSGDFDVGFSIQCERCGISVDGRIEKELTCFWNRASMFTREEIEAIRRMFNERYPRARELSEIDQCIIVKCDARLEGGA